MALIYNASFNSQTRTLSLLDKAGNVISSCEVPSKSNELTLTATADNSSVKLTKSGSNSGSLSNTFDVNTGSGWQSYTFGTVINLNNGQSCKWRCSAHPTTQSALRCVKFVMTGTIEASGDVNSMLSSDFENMTSLSGYDYAFYYLFNGCTALTKAPDLPATALASSCYDRMFYGCTSLTQAPDLPATALASSCYISMFNGCTSLNEVRIAATTTATDALKNWLNNVAASGDFYCNPNATSFPSGISGIPEGWSRFVLGATDTGTTTTMYHNGVAETVRVGTSSYGTCYSAQGWAGFRLLSEMHEAGYTLQAPVLTTMYHNSSTESIDKIEANGADGFTEDMYILNSTLNTLGKMHVYGYTLGAQTAITMYSYITPVSAYSCVANVDDGFTETMYDVGNGQGYSTIAQQNANGYYMVSTEFAGLILTATADNSSVALTKNGTLSNTYEVNMGDGSGWQSYTFGTTINLNNGDKCRWRCSAHPTTQSDSNYVKFVMTGTIEASGNVNSMRSRNFETVTSLSNYAFRSLFSGCTALTKAPDLPATNLAFNCYNRMFYGCTSLTQAPDLPATTLAQECYFYMFCGCTSLTQAPDLPSKYLYNRYSCYRGMFYDCSSLAEVSIAAITIDNTSLQDWLKNVAASGDFYCNPSATIFPADSASGIPANWNRWVYGAEDTGNTTTMYHNGSAETVRVGTSGYGACYSAQGWAGFKTLAQMHALGYTLGAQTPLTMYNYDSPVSAYSCAANIDDGFTETMYDVGDGKGYLTIVQQNANGYYLTSTPFTGLTLTATADNSSVKLTKNGTLSNKFEVNTGSGWQSYTFGTVINLNNGQSCKWRCSAHPTTQSGSNNVQFVMTGTIEASGNCNSMLSRDFENMTSLSGYNYAFIFLFQGCASLTKAPDLPAITLANQCYNAMFSGCTSLTQAPVLPATTLTTYCYSGMFDGCTSLTQAPELPATTLANYCYSYMFNGCTGLTQAPELPATTLANYCYFYMFNGCSALAEVRISATTTATDALKNWLSGVAASGTVYADPSFTGLPANSENGVPSGWTRANINDYPNP